MPSAETCLAVNMALFLLILVTRSSRRCLVHGLTTLGYWWMDLLVEWGALCREGGAGSRKCRHGGTAHYRVRRSVINYDGGREMDTRLRVAVVGGFPQTRGEKTSAMVSQEG